MSLREFGRSAALLSQRATIFMQPVQLGAVATSTESTFIQHLFRMASRPNYQQFKLFQSARTLWESLQVQVPPMGESITEGSVAGVLKTPGAAVSQDDVILQIETDKVTIDVRAPQGGVMEQVLVNEGDNIVVGQLVAVINTAADAAEPNPASISQQAAAAAPMDSAQSQPSRRSKMIKFPPRRTPEGVAISTLPADEQRQYLQAMQPAPSSRAAEPPVKSSSQTTPVKPQVIKLAKNPERRILTEREMEVIMLGGADP